MKKYFFTGLVILLPLAITLLIVGFIINFFTKPFLNLIEPYLLQFTIYTSNKMIFHFIAQLLLLSAIFLLIVILGFLTRILVFKWVIDLYDHIMHKIPFVKSLYKAAKQVIKAIFGNQARSFKQVVLVPFPVKGSYAIGLVSSPAPSICEKIMNTPLVSVFVPTTPNPTSGYLMMYRQEEVMYIDMKIEDAFKYIISCGVITSDDPLAALQDEGFTKAPPN